MNKTELISKVAERAVLRNSIVSDVVNALLEVASEELASGGKIQLTGFGNFEVKKRAARQAKNPQTGEAISIPATKVPVFKPGKALKDAVKNG